MAVGRFLAGIGVLLWNPANDTYLLLRRADSRDYGAGNWECVTGRLDQGEGFEEALRREVREEAGVAVQIEFIIGTSHFYRGEPVPENELVGLVFCCSVEDPAAVTVSAEHAEARWVTVEEAYVLLADDAPSRRWLRTVIERAEALRRLLPDEVRRYYRDHGFATN